MLKHQEKVGGFTTAMVKNNFTSAGGFYGDIDPGMSIRPPMDRSVYEYYRPNERIPTARSQEDYRQIMIMCRKAYERVGVIHSVIDMMSEFAADGIEIIHPDHGPNEFYKAWRRKVNLDDRAERFLSWLYKNGNTVVRRKFAKVKNKDFSDIRKLDDPGTGRIPIEYVFYDPATIELVGGEIGALSDKKEYALRIPFVLFDGLRSPKNELERQVYESLPREIKDAIAGKTGDGLFYLPIPSDKIFVAHYKKDDCDIWAKSFIYSILDDVFYNDKLKLAKTSALDGWYNVIRLWKLGDHTERIAPDPDAGIKLANILQANTGGGTSDIIWTSDITFEAHYPPIEQLVNFEENIDSILMGLGVPDTLVGGESGGGKGSSSMTFLGLKNMIKRLEAGRRAVRAWLNAEIDIIQKEMGFRNRPIIRFSNSDLHDEQTYLSLLVQLVDRNIISDETMLERIKEFVEIERPRIEAEMELREEGEIPEKASPYHKPDLEPQQDHEIKKIKLQGVIDKENTDNSKNVQRRVNTSKKSTNGRPSGSKDTLPRRRTANKVKSTAAKLLIEAERIYDYVDDFVKQNATSYFSVGSIRELSVVQENELDKIRMLLFALTPPFSDLTQANMMDYMTEAYDSDEFVNIYNDSLQDLGAEKINASQKRLLRLNSYIDYWLDEN